MDGGAGPYRIPGGDRPDVTDHAAQQTELYNVDEEAVSAYLSDHPDLLLRRPELLSAIELQHECGDARSLIEHQVGVLREQNTVLQRRLNELLAVARHNDGTAERLHRLTLELLNADDLHEAVETLKAGLHEGFQADAVGVILVGAVGGDPLPEVVTYDDARLRALAGVLDEGVPFCGVITDAQRRIVFDQAADRVASATLIPLVDRRHYGVLGIGSDNPDRFHTGQGTVFLRRLGAIAARVVSRHLGDG